MYRYPIINGQKECGRCHKIKAVDDFYIHRQANTVENRCKQCANKRTEEYRRSNMKRVSENSNQWQSKNASRAREIRRKTKYGMPYGAFDKMLETQGGKCAICQSPDPQGRWGFHVDHCHKTKIVRGILCKPCNNGLGHFRDSRETLLAAAKYLQKTSAIN